MAPNYTKIQHRRDTVANWTSVNPTLAAGELGAETNGAHRVRIGDGSTAWSALPDILVPVVSLRACGAKGDGTTDDSTAMATAVTALVALGTSGAIYAQAGTYILDACTFAALTGGVRLFGDGPGLTVFKHKDSATAAMLTFASTITGHVRVEHLTLDGNRANQTAFRDLISFDGTSGASLTVEHFACKSWRSYVITATNVSARLRVRDLVLASDANETADADVSGGAGVLHAPSCSGAVDVGDWTCVQAALSTNTLAPFAVQIQGTAAQTMSGVIENIHTTRYGHASTGGNPIGVVDCYNRGAGLTIRNIFAYSPANCVVKVANSARLLVDGVYITGQNHDFNSYGIQVGAGTHLVTGDYPGPRILNVRAVNFTADQVVQVGGAAGSEIKRPVVDIDCSGCLGGVELEYIVDGADVTIRGEDWTATLNTQTPLEIETGVTGYVRALIDSDQMANAVAHVYVDSAGASLHVLPGSRFAQDTAAAPIYCNAIDKLRIEHAEFTGTRTQIITTVSATDVRVRNNVGPTSASVSLTGTTVLVEGNSWDRLTGSATFDAGNLVDGAGETTTVTVTGAALGDFVTGVSFSLDLQGIGVTAWVSATNTVSVRFQNETTGAIDLGSGTLRVVVQKRI
jgi:hypothetical protein